MKKNLLFFAAIMGLLFSCRKNDRPSTTNTPQELKQAVEYSKEIYLWNDQLPASMNASQFSSLDDVMEYIKKYSFEQQFRRNVDEWSFAIRQSEWNDVSQGIAGDFGMGIFFMPGTNKLYVKSVEKLSPAGVAGIQRGWQVLKIDGIARIDTTEAAIEAIVTAVFDSQEATITFKKPDASNQQLTLKAATYTEQPVYLDTVYNRPSGKVGYLVYNSFLGDSASVVSNMARVFNKFNTAGISNMIVDLRYNSGGYVWMQELLANYLVNNNASGSKKVMYTENFNPDYQDFDTTVYFNKKSSLNLDKIYFLTTQGTASASELLINSLKPYMTVNTVGTRTDGKAVGFFPIEVGSWYIFPVSFRSLNASRQGNYFDGIQPTVTATDGLDRNWGDVQESMLAAALAGIDRTGLRTMAALPAAQPVLMPVANQELLKYENKLRGAVESRRRLRSIY